MSNSHTHTTNSNDLTNEKTPYEMWAELRDLVLSLEKDAQKATRGMKAGGVRLRTKLQDVREHCVEMRKVVLEYRSARRSHSGSESNDNGAIRSDEVAMSTTAAEEKVMSSAVTNGSSATAESDAVHFAPQPGKNSWFEAGSSRHRSVSRSA